MSKKQMIPDVLEKIINTKKMEVESAKKTVSLSEMVVRSEDRLEKRAFVDALFSSASTTGAGVIAEIKKASPSKGIIRADFNPQEIARSYEAAGASCLSVLTDEEYFKGSLSYLQDVRKVSTLPLLRKDFMIDAYQLYEAKANGADCILLIAAALEVELLKELYEQASAIDLDVLIEVHTQQELEAVLPLSPRLIGINNRNLRDFSTSLDTTIDLLDLIPNNVMVVTESGIHTQQDVSMMKGHGVSCFLVGEAFMREPEPGLALKTLFYPQE